MKQAQIIDERIRSIAQREREALGELIVELKNLDNIRGYESLGYSSLFDYLTLAVGCSAGAAQRRIDAARMLKSVPSLSEKLQSGALDLHHVTTVSKAIRQTQKKRKVSVEEKRLILEQLEAKTQGETQQTVAQFFALPVITSSKKSIQQDSSVRLEITISSEVAKLLEEAQALISHSVPTQNLADFLEYVARKIIKQKTSVPKYEKPSHEAPSPGDVEQKGNRLRSEDVKNYSDTNLKTNLKTNLNKEQNAKESNPKLNLKPRPKAVPIRVHRLVRTHQPVCEKCKSTWFLQTDHKKSKWAGGTNELSNLQTLCGACNRRKYFLESRVKNRGDSHANPSLIC